MKKQYSGKTVQDAIEAGLRELGIGFDEANIKIISEGSRGLFGIGAKNAVVEIDQDNDDVKAVLKEVEQEAAAKKEKSLKKQKPVEQKKSVPEQKIAKPSADISNEDYVKYIEDFVKGLLERMGVKATLDIKEQEDNVIVNIYTDATGKVIGYRGETLDAIQYITRLSLYKNEMDYKSVIVQTENYREKREQTLENLANRLAVKIQKTKKKIVLEPMKPYERRIIHATLQENEFVKTWSEGEEPRRHVVIAPK